jgi:hypothetical protein
VPETLRQASWPGPVERLRAASAALWPSGTNPLQPAAAMTPSDSEPPAREPSEPEPPGSRAPEPAAWSLFTPVVPAEPPAYDDLEPYPSFYEPPHVSQPLEPAEPSADLPDDAAEPSSWNGADEWDAFSVRVGDDDAWLRGLREEPATPPMTTRAEGVDDLREQEAFPFPQPEAFPEPAPVTEERADGPVPEAAADEPAPIPVVEDEPRDEAPDDLVVDAPVPGEPELDDVPVRLDDRPPAAVHQPPEGPPDGPPAGPPETPHRGFGRPSADRLSRALSDDASSSGPIGRRDDDDGPPLRGTLEPVLRRSTERAKVVPVIRPPVMPPAPPAGGPQVPIRPAPVSWAEAMAGDVVPGKKRRRRRLARARHESAGATEEYRPRAGADRSLTLLVVGMLLVLALLVGVAVWAFWPRAT